MQKYINPLFNYALAIIFTQVIFYSQNTYSIRNITIKEGHIDPMPIAINSFKTDSFANSRIAKSITEVIKKDLNNCAYFKTLPRAAFIENKTGTDHTPLFASWRQVGAQILLNGEIKDLENKIELSFIIWDTTIEKPLRKQVIELPKKIWRRAGHKIADIIYERITGDKGYFDTKIAYISETGTKLNKVKRVAVMDFDGHNLQYLTLGSNLVLTPRFSPSADKILYLTYVNKIPRVYLYDLRSGTEKMVGDFPGMSFAPRFSPDGRKAIMSVANKGSTNILEIDLVTRKLKKLTNNSFINTSPSYSPDGKQIVFNSNRSGTRQIYIMDSDGSNVRRISSAYGSYATPVWSPTGEYIAFTKIRGGFSIGVMTPDGTEERIISRGYLVESPTWSPSGRMIMFTREDRSRNKNINNTNIYYIDITGNNEHKVQAKTYASDPEWSNLLE